MVTIRIPIEEVKVGDVVRGQKVVTAVKHHYFSYPDIIKFTRLTLEEGTIDSFPGHIIEVEREEKGGDAVDAPVAANPEDSPQ